MSHFLSCDWGTSTLRLRWVSTSPLEVLEEVRSEWGAARLQAAVLEEFGDDDPTTIAEHREARFDSTLRDAVQALAEKQSANPKELPVVVSGMATSTIGWRELPYGVLPLRLDGAGLPTAKLEANALRTNAILLVSGVREAADVMRGEEVEILGLLNAAEYADYRQSSLLILPGTHSKHVRIDREEIVAFATFMTGELFEVMSQASILRNSVDADSLVTGWWQEKSAQYAAFQEGVDCAQRTPLSSALFSVRARQVLEHQAPEWGAAYLSGLLVGYELLSAFDSVDEGVPILFCGAERLLGPYRLACETMDCTDRIEMATAQSIDLAVPRAHALLQSNEALD